MLQLNDSCGDVEMGIRGDGLRGFGSDAGAIVGPACRWLGMANPTPAAEPTGNAAGAYGSDVAGKADMAVERFSGAFS